MQVGGRCTDVVHCDEVADRVRQSGPTVAPAIESRAWVASSLPSAAKVPVSRTRPPNPRGGPSDRRPVRDKDPSRLSRWSALTKPRRTGQGCAAVTSSGSDGAMDAAELARDVNATIYDIAVRMGGDVLVDFLCE